MTDFFKRLPEGAGKNVNRKQLRDFIRTLLFEKSPADLADMVETDYSEMSGVALAVIQTMNGAGRSGEFSRILPLIDFALEERKRK
jgi:hypothetical protein